MTDILKWYYVLLSLLLIFIISLVIYSYIHGSYRQQIPLQAGKRIVLNHAELFRIVCIIAICRCTTISFGAGAAGLSLQQTGFVILPLRATTFWSSTKKSKPATTAPGAAGTKVQPLRLPSPKTLEDPALCRSGRRTHPPRSRSLRLPHAVVCPFYRHIHNRIEKAITYTLCNRLSQPHWKEGR